MLALACVGVLVGSFPAYFFDIREKTTREDVSKQIRQEVPRFQYVTKEEVSDLIEMKVPLVLLPVINKQNVAIAKLWAKMAAVEKNISNINQNVIYIQSDIREAMSKIYYKGGR